MRIWITRDKKMSHVGLYVGHKPERLEDGFISSLSGHFIGCVLADYFPEVTAENSPAEYKITTARKSGNKQ